MVGMVILESVAKLLAASIVAVYLGLVLMSYKLDGPGQALRLDWRDPARSIERISVWAGVKVLASAVAFGHYMFSLLSETSADLGEEYARRRPHSALAAFRSRFI